LCPHRSQQSSWLLLLKYQDALECDKAAETALESQGCEFIPGRRFRWQTGAPPEGAYGWRA
jgi:type I restriction enzyme M protein